jgi:GntR family transcriptional repressor for pyruvate dehydrogenase complex
MAKSIATEFLEPAPSLASMLAQKLRAEIESRRLRIGAKFPTDAEIARRFGVSRTVVREAVSSLREAGLISTQRGRGSIVIAHSTSPGFSVTGEELESVGRIIQLYEFRMIIEPEAAALAALRRNEVDIENLQKVLRQGLNSNTFEDVVDADISFHMSIAQATHNEYFQRIMATIRTATTARALLRNDLDEDGYVELYRSIVQPEHERIADAITRGSETDAKEALRGHLGGQRLERLVASLTSKDL